MHPFFRVLVVLVGLVVLVTLLAWPLMVQRSTVRWVSRTNASEIRKRLLSGATPQELGENTDAEIEQVREFIRKHEGRPGVTQAAGFGEALNHEYRNLDRLQNYRGQVLQIARDLGPDVTGLNDTR